MPWPIKMMIWRNPDAHTLSGLCDDGFVVSMLTLLTLWVVVLTNIMRQ